MGCGPRDNDHDSCVRETERHLQQARLASHKPGHWATEEGYPAKAIGGGGGYEIEVESLRPRRRQSAGAKTNESTTRSP